MERISVRVDERLKKELEAEVRGKGVRPSDIAREALEKHVAGVPHGRATVRS
ncbi:MAG: hypothetical protein ACLP7Q_23040 [Isosphaeraceae bacterium]